MAANWIWEVILLRDAPVCDGSQAWSSEYYMQQRRFSDLAPYRSHG